MYVIEKSSAFNSQEFVDAPRKQRVLYLCVYLYLWVGVYLAVWDFLCVFVSVSLFH